MEPAHRVRAPQPPRGGARAALRQPAQPDRTRRDSRTPRARPLPAPLPGRARCLLCAGSAAATLVARERSMDAALARPGGQPVPSAPMPRSDVAPEAAADESLMLAYAAGETGAFARLYDRHARRVHRFIARSLGSRDAAAADDVLQETWISVARQATRYAPTARFTTWLYTLARSRVIDHLRRQGRGIEVPLDGDDDNSSLAAGLAADERHEPLARLEHRQQALAFLGALDALPLPQR